jgi:hypothetical protein
MDDDGMQQKGKRGNGIDSNTTPIILRQPPHPNVLYTIWSLKATRKKDGNVYV